MLSLGNQVKMVYLYFNLYKENESGYYFKVDFMSFFQLIRDLGPLEWILNTPKHHRVHHGKRMVILSNLTLFTSNIA